MLAYYVYMNFIFAVFIICLYIFVSQGIHHTFMGINQDIFDIQTLWSIDLRPDVSNSVPGGPQLCRV